MSERTSKIHSSKTNPQQDAPSKLEAPAKPLPFVDVAALLPFIQSTSGNRAAMRWLQRQPQVSSRPVVKQHQPRNSIQRILVSELNEEHVNKAFIVRTEKGAFTAKLAKNHLGHLFFRRGPDHGTPLKYVEDAEATPIAEASMQLFNMVYSDLTFLPDDKFTELEKKVTNYNEEWDNEFAELDKGLSTTGMGPCITVGVTADIPKSETHPNGGFVAGLHHSFDPLAKDLDYLAMKILGNLHEKLEQKTGLSYDELLNVKHYVVGGDNSSLDKARAIIERLILWDDAIGGIALSTDEKPGATTKSFAIDNTGAAFHSKVANKQ